MWEDRAARAGRKLALKVVVLPALRRQPAPDPLFFLAGGPGQGAAKMARNVRDLFRTLQTDRDIVLRVVAAGKDPRTTPVSAVMTPPSSDSSVPGCNQPATRLAPSPGTPSSVWHCNSMARLSPTKRYRNGAGRRSHP